jgi:hypothetical protein
MIAYHFPPIRGSSGIHRTLQFARHLPGHGWNAQVLTVHPRAYPASGPDESFASESEIGVTRAFALDSARHLSWHGRYFGWTAIPDRWISWWPIGVFRGLQIIRKFRVRVLWSTFPVATAHLIALTLHRMTKLPWVADFRDPMIQPTQPPLGVNRKANAALEKRIFQNAMFCTFASPGSLRSYSTKYPWKNPDTLHVIENGFDEDAFRLAESGGNGTRPKTGSKLKLVHSGILYAVGRNPLHFLKALQQLDKKKSPPIEVIFRGGWEMEYDKTIQSMQLTHLVKTLPQTSYSDAIREMISSDGAILFQGKVYNDQIPAKAYEYLRAGIPILALTDTEGDTWRILKNWDGIYQADMEHTDRICTALDNFVSDILAGKAPNRSQSDVDQMSRRSRTGELANLIKDL